MASIYTRGDRLWCSVKNSEGKWRNQKTPYRVGEEAKARRYAAKLEELATAEREGNGTGPLTVAAYAAKWIEGRRARKLRAADDDDTRLRRHALPTIGALLLGEVRPRHVRELVMALRAEGRLAPRTIRHVYATLRTMFHDAVAYEVIDANPCVLERGVLPQNADKDPNWRHTAIFTRREVERLISDECILLDRRVFYALKALAGLRHSEAAELTWHQYDATLEPLGAIHLGKTKSGVPRRIPVHLPWPRSWRLGA